MQVLVDPHSSSTFSIVAAQSFNLSYQDGTGASGDYVVDTMNIGGAVVPQQEMGIAYKTTFAPGILGLGYNTNEEANRSVQYPGLVQQLVRLNKIKSKAFSIWLNDKGSSTR